MNEKFYEGVVEMKVRINVRVLASSKEEALEKLESIVDSEDYVISKQDVEDYPTFFIEDNS